MHTLEAIYAKSNGSSLIINFLFVTEAACAVLYVDPAIIPVVETEEEVQRYVYVTVSCPDVGFEETKEVLLSYEEGFLFIQTDKPVYTPNQRGEN